MKTITLNVQEPYLSFILNGKKTIEGRLNDGKFKDLEIGDILLIGLNEKKLYKFGRSGVYGLKP